MYIADKITIHNCEYIIKVSSERSDLVKKLETM